MVNRKARESGHVHVYTPSRTELAVEDLCTAMGAELQQAYSYWTNTGPILTRNSGPIALKGTESYIVRVQFTRFGGTNLPEEQWLDLARRRLRLRSNVTRETIFSSLNEDYEGLSAAQAVHAHHLPVNIGRFPKEVYMTIDTIDHDPSPEQERNVHEANGRHGDDLPLFFLRYHRSGHLVGHPDREDDSIFASQPRRMAEFNAANDAVYDVNPLGERPDDRQVKLFSTRRVSSDLHPLAAMNYFHTMVKQQCLGRNI